MTFALKPGGLCTLAVTLMVAVAPPCGAQEGAQPAAEGAAAPAAAAPADDAPMFKPEEIEQLVAPIALYPDPLLAQILMASTYPLEIVEAARWQKEHADLKDKALEDALLAQKWDPSVKSLVAFPQVLTMMNEKLDWTQKLGDACLAQQDDVMLAVQRLRNKAQEAGTLQTTKEQKVIVEEKPVAVSQTVNVEQPPPPAQTIVIQPADPQVVYVPSYNPTTAYGSWPYPSYPPYSYYPPGYVAATSMMSFGVGMMAGAALWGDCDWDDCCGGGGDNIKIDVDNYNNFNKTDIKNGNWNHKPEHRKGVGYRDNASRQKYGQGGQRGRQQAASRDAFRGRAESGRQQMARGGAGSLDRGAQARQPGGAQNRAGGRDRGQVQQQARRPQQGQRQPQARQQQTQRRDAGAQTRQAGGSRGGDAFRGMNSDRQQVQRQANRGRSSRQSSFGGGGRAGGGRAGGGGRGGRR